VMAGRLDLEPGAAADSGTEPDQKLGEDRDRIGLGLRLEPPDNLAEQPVIGGRVGRRRPAHRGRQQVPLQRSRVLLWRGGWVKQAGDGGGHSACASATAACAQLRSTVAFWAA
jgi:hypothetical protein